MNPGLCLHDVLVNKKSNAMLVFILFSTEENSESVSGLHQQWQQWPDEIGSGGATPSALQAISDSASLLSPPSSSTAVKDGPCLLTLEKRIQAFETKCLRKLLRISYSEHKTGCGARSTSLLIHMNLFRKLPSEGNFHGLGMSYDTTASPRRGR